MKRGTSEGSLPKIDSTLMSGIRSHHSLVSSLNVVGSIFIQLCESMMMKSAYVQQERQLSQWDALAEGHPDHVMRSCECTAHTYNTERYRKTAALHT